MDILLKFSISIFLLFKSSENVIIKTKTGLVKGNTLKVLNNEINEFLGIPFAIPPTGNLRFQKPQPVQQWSGIHDATKKPPACVQKQFSYDWSVDDNISEDCLYLTIWAPSTNKTKTPFSTMVWIHGGSFWYGSSNTEIYNGQVISSLGNVIVASMNYRLGPFGFFNAGTEDAPGNMGMLDQVEALKWIYNNIAAFGGDPSEITLFGESAGAVSISNHLVSPITSGLFKRGILQSGSNYNPSVTLNSSISKSMAIRLGNFAGCTVENEESTEEMSRLVTCMRELNASTINEISSENIESLVFIPSYGDEYLPNNPIKETDSGHVYNVPIMVGNVLNEGSLFLSFVGSGRLMTDSPVITKEEAIEYLKQFFERVEKIPEEAIINEYLRRVSDDNDTNIIKHAHQLIGDELLVCPGVFTSEKQSTVNNVYYYRFNHRRVKSSSYDWIGATHFDDVAFVFGMPFLQVDAYTDEERLFSHKVIQLWTSFAKCGKPSLEDEHLAWPTYSSENPVFMDLKLNNFTLFYEPPSNCDFWRKYYVNKLAPPCFEKDFKLN